MGKKKETKKITDYLNEYLPTIKFSIQLTSLLFLIFIVLTLKQPMIVDIPSPLQTSQEGVHVLERVIVFTDCLRAEWTTGESMLPTLKPNTYVLIDVCYPKNQLKEGDIIAFYTEGDIQGSDKVMHRIVEIDIENAWVITKGDNNDYNDDIRKFNYIYGKKVE